MTIQIRPFVLRIGLVSAVLLTLLAGAIVAQAAPIDQPTCEGNGGVWDSGSSTCTFYSDTSCGLWGGAWAGSGGSRQYGHCSFPPGSEDNYCGSGQYLIQQMEPEAKKVSGTCSDSAFASEISQASSRGIYCGTIDLPALIEASAVTEISFKGSQQTAGAALVVPGLDGSFPVSGLSYDWGTHTWTGTINTLHVPADKYQNVRLHLVGKDSSDMNCNVGGLTVTQ